MTRHLKQNNGARPPRQLGASHASTERSLGAAGIAIYPGAGQARVHMQLSDGMLKGKKVVVSLSLLMPLLAFGGEPPALPCKTPKELMRAVEYALKRQDTNFFWKLHYWTNVSAERQERRKSSTLHFKGPQDINISYSDFRLIPAPPDVNKVRRRKDGTEIYPNLPIEGLIAYKNRIVSKDVLGRHIRGEAGGDMEYGRAPDGTWWLTVNVYRPVAPTQ